jgi:Ca-activated chloride channel homolog
MSLTWTAPAAFWLLLVVPFVWLALRFRRTNFNSRQRLLQAALRSTLLGVLTLALARPVISLGSSDLSVVYAVDVSHSVSSRAITAAADRIDALNSGVRPAHSRIVAFGADSAVIDGTGALRAMAAVDPSSRGASLVRREGSDLEQGLRAARAELAPGHLPRVVLFSDGRPTSGDVGDAVAKLADEGIPVFVEPLDARDIGDAWIDGIELPAALAAGSLVTATVDVASQRSAPAVVELRSGDKVVGSRQVALVPGANAVPLDVVFDEAGAQIVQATITVPDDPLAGNNAMAREALVAPRARVLYVEGAASSAQYLRAALNRAGFDVDVRPASGLPTAAADLDPWDVVILSDVGRAALSDASMGALAAWVERTGGGLLVAGGEAVFGEGPAGGAGGYRNTELERLTPVTFERKDEPEVALIIVLDKSWSMAGQVMELCKSAAQAAIDVLTDEQSVGVVTFNDGLNWDVTLRNVGKNRSAIKKAVAAIEPSGHTLIFPAIEQAYLALKDARARAKHVVLLSDGRSYPDDYQSLVEKMVDAKITVSSIAVGPAADVELLSNIAKWGKGRSYIVEDAKEVPQIFVKEAKNATTPSFDEKAIRPVVKTRGFLTGIDFGRAPSLRGRTATVLKDSATELLATEDGDPLLAFWPIGLGRSAVFASDVKDRWASDWLKWRGYGPFFASVVRALERRRPPAVALGVTSGPVRSGARPLAIAVEARDATGQYRDLLKPVVHVQSADGSARDLPARQTSPGRYEASVVADASQTLTITVNGTPPTVAARLIVPDPAAEYRFRPADTALLASIAQATDGVMNPDAAALAKAGARARASRRALWPALVLLGLGLWLVDLLLRRVRVFE